MIKNISLQVLPEVASTPDLLLKEVSIKANVKNTDIYHEKTDIPGWSE